MITKRKFKISMLDSYMKHRQTDRKTDRHTETLTHIIHHTHKHTHTHTHAHAQAHTQTQTDTQTHTHTHAHTHTYTPHNQISRVACMVAINSKTRCQTETSAENQKFPFDL